MRVAMSFNAVMCLASPQSIWNGYYTFTHCNRSFIENLRCPGVLIVDLHQLEAINAPHLSNILVEEMMIAISN